MNARDILRQLFDAAIAAADPESCLPPHMLPDDGGRLIVIGAGKASAAMARERAVMTASRVSRSWVM
jgi:hydroxypyruvate reductase